MDEVERQMWCEAWRMVVRHGDDAVSFAHAQLRACLQQNDHAAVAHWRTLAEAIEELGK